MSREIVDFDVIRDRIKIVRKQLELSQEAFGKPVLLRRQDVYAIETGARQPGLTVLVRLSSHYNISLDWLVWGIGKPFFIKEPV